MRTKFSIADARANLPELIRQTEQGACIEITRRGEGVAMLVSIKEMQRLRTKKKTFLEAFRDLHQFGADGTLSKKEIDQLFSEVRDKNVGRKVSL